MKKRIVAAVMALLMVASSMPMAEMSQLVPDFGISASAATQSGTVEVNGFKINYTSGQTEKDNENETKEYLKITVPPAYFITDDNYSSIKIDTTAIKNELTKAGVTAGPNGVILDCRFGASGSPVQGSLAHVEISGSDKFVTKLGDNMFQGCSVLQTVTLNNTVTEIGKNVFSGCKYFVGTRNNNNIMKLNNVTEIAASAFQNCTELMGVDLSNNKLLSIGDNAFSGCTKIKEISIPATTRFMGNNVFTNDSALEKVTFAAKSVLKRVGNSVFQSCSALSKVYFGTVENTLPSSLVEAGTSMFSGCKTIQTFRIPKGLKYISDMMFQNCSALNKVTFENGSVCKWVGMSAFENCTSLTDITVADSVKGLGSAAFKGCKVLKNCVLPDGLVYLSTYKNNSYRNYVDTPDLDPYVGIDRYDKSDDNSYNGDTAGGAFAGCEVLSISTKTKKAASNQIIIPSKVIYIPQQTFAACTGITSVDMSGVKDIGKAAFQNCIKLPKVTVPDAVRIIRPSVFQGCSALKSVVYSKNLLWIYTQAFKDCKVLSQATPSNSTAMTNTIIVPSTLNGIDKEAFANCVTFKYLNILGGDNNDKFATVGEKAFQGCTSLEGSTTNGTSSEELKFPKGYVVVQNNTFEKCNKLKSVKFAGNVSSVGDYAFANCSALNKVVMNPTITQLGNYAFQNCTSLKDLPVTAAGKTAVTQLQDIKNYTFDGCTSLTTVDISDAKSITAIGISAFSRCSGLKKVVLPSNGAVATIADNAFQNDTALALIAPSKTATKSSLPNSISKIGSNAFANTALTEMTIVKPKNASEHNDLGTGVFSNCTKLTTVDLSGSNAIEVPKSMFMADKVLTSIKLPTTVETIAESAFDGCEKLSTINSTTKGEAKLPASVKTIGNYAFKNNHCISRMVIPAATDNISLSAWDFNLTYKQEDLDSGKYNPLKEFVVDSKNADYMSKNGVLYSKDGSQLFIYPVMKNGKSFTVPSSVTSITQSAFSSNNILETVTMPTNLKNIDKFAFNRCENLKSISFGNNKTVQFDTNAFSGLKTNPKLVFYAAKGSTAESYANANSSYITFVDNNMQAVKVVVKQGSSISMTKNTSTVLEAQPLTAKGEVTTDVLTWTSSDSTIASVDNSGRVTARGNDGVATLTVKTANGYTATVTVEVGDKITRFAGAGRYDTAAKISQGAFKENTQYVVLAYGMNSADALAGVSLAKALNAPILLTNKDELPQETINEIKRLKATNVIILGGTGAISTKVESALKNKAGIGAANIERIAGSSRFGTATAVANKLEDLKSSKPTEVFFVYAYNYADALSVSTVAAVKGAPIIYLATKGSIDADTAAYLKSIKGSVKKAYVVGGSGVISDAMMKSAASAIGLSAGSTVERVAGANRYLTCKAVNEKFADVLSGTALCIAKGLDFPDALAGGVYAAMKNSPLFLADGNKLTNEQTEYLKNKKATKFYVFGGTGAVSDTLVAVISNVR
ncbi:MAG: leucine-rich repeat protein [Ruminococcus sp.]|nr:leucine-rich repeat protein [Ruminococcus sp.]